MAHVREVCIVHRIRPGYFHDTAIDKRPSPGRVEVTGLGLAGDRHVDSGHGGKDAAVYVYDDQDASCFAELLGRDLPPGFLGENVRSRGLDVTGALIGERWRIGEVLLEVRKPRTPCQNLSLRVGVEGFHLDFHRSGRVGAMCRVLATGSVGAGDEIVVEHRPDHDVTIGAWTTGIEAGQAQALLDSGTPLAASVRAKARRVLSRGVQPAPSS